MHEDEPPEPVAVDVDVLDDVLSGDLTLSVTPLNSACVAAEEGNYSVWLGFMGTFGFGPEKKHFVPSLSVFIILL